MSEESNVRTRWTCEIWLHRETWHDGQEIKVVGQSHESPEDARKKALLSAELRIDQFTRIRG